VSKSQQRKSKLNEDPISQRATNTFHLIHNKRHNFTLTEIQTNNIPTNFNGFYPCL